MANAATSGWSDEEIERLKALHAAGTPTRDVAGELGRSRGAVIGKLHRLGLSTGTSTRKIVLTSGNVPPLPPKRVERKPIIVVQLPGRATPPTAPRRVEPARPRPGCTIHELKTGICRWPLGHWLDRPPYSFCGQGTIMCEETGRREVYCPLHTMAALKETADEVAAAG